MISYSGLKDFCKNNSSLILFFSFFIIYFTSGLYITFLNNSVIEQYDIIFNADCPRVYLDFLNWGAYHTRINVHPLQLILLQPLFLIANTFLRSPKAALLLVQALAGASIVCLIKNILLIWTHNQKVSLLISIIYGISFSSLIFTSIPETYIFAALINAMLFHYISLLFKKEEKLTVTNYIVIALLTLFSFGIIPVSLISNLILIICLLKNKVTMKNFLKLFCLMLALYVSFTFMQKFAYPNSPTFFRGAIKGDLRYTDFDLNLKKPILIGKGILAGSFYSLKIKKLEKSTSPNGLLIFDREQNNIYYIPGLLLFGLMIFCLIFKRKYFAEKKYPIGCLILILAINFVQLYFYGTRSSFLYSQNLLLYLVTLLGLSYSCLPQKCPPPVCISFIVFQLITNIPAISIVEKHARFGSIKHNHWTIWLLYALISAIVLYLISILLKKVLNKNLLELSTEKKYIYYLSLFIILVIVNSIFLVIFHGRIE